jgi:hypothetical protein
MPILAAFLGLPGDVLGILLALLAFGILYLLAEGVDRI